MIPKNELTTIKRIINSSLLLFVITLNSYTQSPVIKVDFDMSGRPEAEVNEPGYEYWPIEAAPSVSRIIDGVDFKCAYTGNGTGLKSNWYKTHIQAPYYVRLTGDGITVDNGQAGAQIILTISGLPAGNHTLLVYHNNVDNPDNNTFSPIDIYLNGSQTYNDLIPSVRARSNYEAARSYHSFSVSSGQDIEIRFEAETSSSASNKNVMINGFELNVPNPEYQAIFPFPANKDEHFNGDKGSVALSWTSASNAVSHDVYISTDLTELENATHSSSLFKGNQSNTTYQLSGLYSMNTYYWRIDEIASDGTVTKGQTWYFRPRQLAFPAAEGYGQYARGGRGGAVVHVTNLKDSGPGSLREAIENDIGPRTIVFDVSGIITLESRLVLGDKYVTVAGQTAPGKGICIRSAPFGIAGAVDAVVQHIRARLGYGQTYDCMGLTGSNYSILDHCSISWGIDEVFSSRSAKNITLQRCLVSEALNIADHANYPSGNMHGYAASISGDVGSFHHNLLAHCYGRNWSLAGGLDGNGYYAGRLDIFNNVVYNWGSRTTDGGAHEVNFVNNYYKPGPSTRIFTALNPQYDGFPGTQQYYMSGNVMPGHFDESNQMDGTNPQGTPPYDLFVSSSFFPSYATIHSASDAYKNVISDVGCTQPVFDDHDLRIVSETRDGTYTFSGSRSGLAGHIDHENDAGGYEDYPKLTRDANYDTDGDGLPNWWETYYGSNINSGLNDFSEANADNNLDGYTNLDDFLQWIAKPHYFISGTETVTINLGQMFLGYTINPSYSSSNVINGNVTIQSGTATFTPSGSGMASFNLSVTDGEGSNMTKQIGVFIEGDVANYSLTTKIKGEGSVSPGSGRYPEGSVVTITATPDAGWQFEGWSGDASGTDNPFSLTMDTDKTITATFAKVPVTGISVSPATASVNIGGTVQLTAKVEPSNATNQNVNWSSGNTAIVTVSSAGLVTGVAEGSATITVATEDGGFAASSRITVTGGGQTRYTLSTSVNGNGNISLEPSGGVYDEGTTVSITAVPASGWSFDTWSGALSGTNNPGLITMSSDLSVTANFSESQGAPCDNPVSISMPFKKDGEGVFCWVTSDDIAYLNSWNMNLLEVNGVDFTNKYASGSDLPAWNDGKYYIYYDGLYPWSHFEAIAAKSASMPDNSTKISLYPNPFSESANMIIDNPESVQSIMIINQLGRTVEVIGQSELNTSIGIGTSLKTGMYFIQVLTTNEVQTMIIHKY